ncbi:MAG TPA: nucleoside triphosphate pyrophosphohydrolase [Bacteroidales bacterium]|jgi:XTP/dITP diphosphohydrolase|nr:nucleoside triphosphate pyrophosphohydrolase [Lentimicrobium sp.]OQC36342.1 MAG: Nucleoside triphosphate pyrophosphohydrolase [Bacteroidetes bacterium ADurb.Bin041]HNV49496.1 nucleoside triphosphate pyrophosphohydrolase [Bacteroidales bacterium]HOG66889.1 nucleoside triphosphate pyrophosphohydrolase [Bacteroidales bacterium]HPW42629.1 nucleoside triphosphate pyrophosphohydrolase [Bacteroidales bacterium]
MKEKLAAFERLLNIMDDLRNGCPWDKKQTFESLRYLTIEETYELSDAILEKDISAIKKELGDLMLHLVFYAKIGSETGDFDIKDVLNDISEKLIQRHPHIFGNVKVTSADDVKNNWEKIKLKEKDRKSVLSGVPNSLPAIVKAFRMQEKVSGVGFDWENAEQVWEKVKEEMEELQNEVRKRDSAKIEMELGDLLFSLVNYSRLIGINPEDALERTNKKFIKRFKYIEEQAKKKGKSLQGMSLPEMDTFWEEAKKTEKQE